MGNLHYGIFASWSTMAYFIWRNFSLSLDSNEEILFLKNKIKPTIEFMVRIRHSCCDVLTDLLWITIGNCVLRFILFRWTMIFISPVVNTYIGTKEELYSKKPTESVIEWPNHEAESQHNVLTLHEILMRSNVLTFFALFSWIRLSVCTFAVCTWYSNLYFIPQ